MAVLTVLVVMTVLAVLANSWQFSLQVYFQAVTELLSPRLHPDMCTQTFPRGHPFLGDTPQSSACRYLHTTSSRWRLHQTSSHGRLSTDVCTRHVLTDVWPCSGVAAPFYRPAAEALANGIAAWWRNIYFRLVTYRFFMHLLTNWVEDCR